MDARLLGWTMALTLAVAMPRAWGQLGAGVGTGADQAEADKSDKRTEEKSAGGASSANATGGAIKLAEKPLHLENIGMTISLPIGAKAESTTMADQAAVTIKDGEGAWVVSMRMTKTKRLEMTAKELAEIGLEQIFGRKDVKVGDSSETKTTLTGIDAEMKINELEASRFYIELPAEDPRNALVRGATMIRVEPGRFAAFEVMVPKSRFEASRAAVETMIATAKFADEAGLMAGRRAAIDAGQRFLDELTTEDIDQAVAAMKERWVRVYKPAETGADSDATEIGYQRIRAWNGMRGEIDSKRKPAEFSETERELGTLVRIDARLLNDEQGKIIDTQAIFFVSRARDREAWGVTTVTKSTRENEVGRDGRKKPPTVSSEVGTREGVNIVVIGDMAEKRQHEIKVPPEAYLSRVESVLLPQLMLNKKLEVEFGFYSYQSDAKLVRMRRDRLEKVAGSDSLWKIYTTLNQESDETVSTFRDGEMTQVLLGGGLRMEPTSMKSLLNLWKSKGLPLE